jgi:hypothetical protein
MFEKTDIPHFSYSHTLGKLVLKLALPSTLMVFFKVILNC